MVFRKIKSLFTRKNLMKNQKNVDEVYDEYYNKQIVEEVYDEYYNKQIEFDELLLEIDFYIDYIYKNNISKLYDNKSLYSNL